MPERESDYYLQIQISDSYRDKPLFNWSQAKGNIAFGIAVAKEEVDNKIPVGKEGHFSILIKLHNDKINREVFSYRKQGHIRAGLEQVDEFARFKLGFNLVDQVKAFKQPIVSKVYYEPIKVNIPQTIVHKPIEKSFLIPKKEMIITGV